MADHLSVTVSSYTGHEEQVLQFRNRNRPVPRTRAYMDWRYLGQQSSLPPRVFWIRSYKDTTVGMASIIFRPFCIDGRAQYFAVVGDISVDREFRGRGISKRLYSSINDYLTQQACPCAMVIPNLPARRGLESSGWTAGGSFVRYAFFLNPAVKLGPLLRSSVCSRFSEKISRAAVRMAVSLFAPKSQMRLEPFTEFDSSIDALWQGLPKKELILSDRSTSTLRWRYKDHPSQNFRFLRLMDDKVTEGYIIYSAQAREVIIYDLLVNRIACLKPLLGTFIANFCEDKNFDSVHMSLNESHPYKSLLTGAGFVRRREKTSFLIYTSDVSMAASGLRWLVTSGDKDA